MNAGMEVVVMGRGKCCGVGAQLMISVEMGSVLLFLPCIFRVDGDWWMIVFGVKVAYFVV